LFLFNGIDFEMGMCRFLHLHRDSGVFLSKLCQRLMPQNHLHLLMVIFGLNPFFCFQLFHLGFSLYSFLPSN